MTEWFEDFNDGDISDWTIQNPFFPGTNPITLGVSDVQWHSSPYSLLVDSPHESGYTAKAWGPYVPVDLSQPYSVEFWFRWNGFHWADFLGFGHIGATLDYPDNPIVLYSNGYHSVGPDVQSYCPANTWTYFQFYVDPNSSSYTMVVDGNTILTFDYVMPNPDVTQFFFVDTGSSSNDYFDHCYYDDIHVAYYYPNEPPIANFTYTADDLSVIFNAALSDDIDGNISTWNWDFGDDTYGSGEIVTHVYPTSGTYNVTLTVVDDDGAEDSIIQSITVEKYQTAIFFGKITNLVSQGDFIQFEAVKTRVITTNPFSFNTYTSGEKFIVSKEYKGKIGVKFIFALCKIRI
jgi:PKD repeat protein